MAVTGHTLHGDGRPGAAPPPVVFAGELHVARTRAPALDRQRHRDAVTMLLATAAVFAVFLALGLAVGSTIMGG